MRCDVAVASEPYNQASLTGNNCHSGGALIGTATHMIPKRRMAEFFLGTYVEPGSREEFEGILRASGFKEVELVQTTPPTMSIGIAKK